MSMTQPDAEGGRFPGRIIDPSRGEPGSGDPGRGESGRGELGAAGEGAPRPGPQLHVDSDWKAQAQAEKERLAKQEEARQKDRPRGAAGELPQAEFRTILQLLASQAVVSLGGYGDAESGRVIVDLPGAKLMIDLLDVLQQKTKGNLTAEEAEDLTGVLVELRSRFVHFAELVARQRSAAAEPGAAGSAAPPRIVQP